LAWLRRAHCSAHADRLRLGGLADIARHVISYTSHTPLIHLSYTSHTPLIHPSSPPHTPLIHPSLIHPFFPPHTPLFPPSYTAHSPLIAQAPDGGVFVVGEFVGQVDSMDATTVSWRQSSLGAGTADGFLMKINKEGFIRHILQLRGAVKRCRLIR